MGAKIRIFRNIFLFCLQKNVNSCISAIKSVHQDAAEAHNGGYRQALCWGQAQKCSTFWILMLVPDTSD